jgi:hypothetical protein
MSFEQKYLKYKNKYSSLKNMMGGAPNDEVGKLRGILDTITGEIDAANEALRNLTIALSSLDTPKLPLDGKWKELVEQMKKASNGTISEDQAIMLINAELKNRTPTIHNIGFEDINKILRAQYS